MTPPRIAHASAPLRLDFAGGWTDVPPFCGQEGGLVVNAAIGLCAHATVKPGGEEFLLISEDLNERLEVPRLEDLRADGPLALLQSALRLFPLSGCEVRTRSQAPAGSGLGSSGAVDVALVSALAHARGDQLDRGGIAEAAWRVEAVEAGMPGGKQDQYASAFGGFQRLEFAGSIVTPHAIELDAGFTGLLERNIVLCYTGTSRISGGMISRVMAGYERGQEEVVGALLGMKEVASAMADALTAADVARVGQLLSRNWDYQRRLDPGIQTYEMARLEYAVGQAGILGGKAAGAGAGGCMFFLARENPDAVAAAALGAGARTLPVSWVREGVRTW